MNNLLLKKHVAPQLWRYEIQTPAGIKNYSVYFNEHGRWVWKHLNGQPSTTTYNTQYAAEMALYKELGISP